MSKLSFYIFSLLQLSPGWSFQSLISVLSGFHKWELGSQVSSTNDHFLPLLIQHREDLNAVRAEPISLSPVTIFLAGSSQLRWFRRRPRHRTLGGRGSGPDLGTQPRPLRLHHLLPGGLFAQEIAGVVGTDRPASGRSDPHGDSWVFKKELFVSNAQLMLSKRIT